MFPAIFGRPGRTVPARNDFALDAAIGPPSIEKSSKHRRGEVK
ncbi:MAG: hypothetical protein M0Z91_02405 [Actinomycetota bacterium]|jgi:hypothetical protein|nr:hypothetical protein [Actinomycetota bacterium]